eukprot:scaffold2349_cov407-Prasinococcus_capsulatus_cf.AAC.8
MGWLLEPVRRRGRSAGGRRHSHCPVSAAAFPAPARLLLPRRGLARPKRGLFGACRRGTSLRAGPARPGQWPPPKVTGHTARPQLRAHAVILREGWRASP